MAVQMELSRILITETQDHQMIELREVDGERRFPIAIGLYEAGAIERRLKGIQLARPWTHELLSNTIEALGGRLKHVLISDLRDQTFFAMLVIEVNGKQVEVDCRPSDAIALCVAGEAPILVAEQVLDKVAIE